MSSTASSSTQLHLYASTRLTVRDATVADGDDHFEGLGIAVARQDSSGSLLRVLLDSCLQGSSRNSQDSDTSCNRASSDSTSTSTSEKTSSCGTVIPSAWCSPSTSLRASLECNDTSTSAAIRNGDKVAGSAAVAVRETGLASQGLAWRQPVKRSQAGGAASSCACWQSGACTNAPCSIPFLCLTRIQMRWLGLVANDGLDAGTPGVLDAAPATRGVAPGGNLQVQSQCSSLPPHSMAEDMEDVRPTGRSEASSATTSLLASTTPCGGLGTAASPSAATSGMLHEAGEPKVSGPWRPFIVPGGILTPANSAALDASDARTPMPAATLHRVMSEDALQEELLLPVVPHLAAGGAGDRPAAARGPVRADEGVMAISYYSPSVEVVKAMSDDLGDAAGMLCNGRSSPGRSSLLVSASPACDMQPTSDGTVEVKRAPRSSNTKKDVWAPLAPITPQQSYKEHDHQRSRDSIFGYDLAAREGEAVPAPARPLPADGSTDRGSSEGNIGSEDGPEARSGAPEDAEVIDGLGKHGSAEKHAGQEAFKVFVLVAATDEEHTTGSSSSSLRSASSSSTEQTEVTVWTLLKPDVPKPLLPEPRPTSYDTGSRATSAAFSTVPPVAEASHDSSLPSGICAAVDAARREPAGWHGWRVSGVAASAFGDCIGNEEDMGTTQDGCNIMPPVVPWDVATYKTKPAQLTVGPAQPLPSLGGAGQRSISPVKPATVLRDSALPPGICNAVDAIRKESSGWLGWRVSGAVAAALADEDEDVDGLEDGMNIMLPLMPWAVAESKPMHGVGLSGAQKNGGTDGLQATKGSSGGDDLMLPGMPWTLAKSGGPWWG